MTSWPHCIKHLMQKRLRSQHLREIWNCKSVFSYFVYVPNQNTLFVSCMLMTWRWPTKAATCFHKLYTIYSNKVVLILSTYYHNFGINSVAVASVLSQQFLYWLFCPIITVFCYWFCEDKFSLLPQFCKRILQWLVRFSHHNCDHIPQYISQSHSNFSLEHDYADDTYQIVHHVSSLFPYLLQ
jgi:hypothetical protein